MRVSLFSACNLLNKRKYGVTIVLSSKASSVE